MSELNIHGTKYSQTNYKKGDVMNLIRSFLTIVFMMMGFQAQAQQLAVGEKDEEGRTYLFDEPLEGVYSNYWSGMRVGGDGSDQTDIHIRSDGKTVFQGVISIYCNNSSGHDWVLNADEAEHSVPLDVVSSARTQFCVKACNQGNEPGLSYVSKDLTVCQRVRYVCKPNESPFTNDCGCGCQVNN